MDYVLKIASLAPIHTDSLGFFLAGENENGEG
jgi:hypothetical protein